MTRKELVAYRTKLYTELRAAERAFDKSGSVRNRQAVTAASRTYEAARWEQTDEEADAAERQAEGGPLHEGEK